jgi:long-chain fatty acid transport protein
VQASYEPSIDKPLGLLNPTDGSVGLGVATSYTMDSGVRIGGGIGYRWLGDSTIQGALASADFEDNHALGVGMQVSVRF